MSASPGVAASLGASIALERLRRRGTAVSLLLGAALVVASALIERRASSIGGLDRTLTATFHLVVPLVSFGVVAQALGRQRLGDGLWSAARFGVARRSVALGAIAVAIVASALASLVLVLLAVGLAHGPGDPPLARDLFTSGWIAAVTGMGYAGWFSLGATFGRRGGGRWLALAADFVLGGGTGVLGVLLPRGNANNLLGLSAPLALGQTASTAALVATALVLGGLAALRCRE